MVQLVPARADWLEALIEGDAVFTERFGVDAVDGWAGFPEALPYALDGVRAEPENLWGAHFFLDDTDGALVGFGGFKGAPVDGEVELGYAVAPARQGRGIATDVVRQLIERALEAGVTTVTAHTLGEPNASTAVLVKSGFAHTADLDDDELGTVWRWERRVS